MCSGVPKLITRSGRFVSELTALEQQRWRQMLFEQFYPTGQMNFNPSPRYPKKIVLASLYWNNNGFNVNHVSLNMFLHLLVYLI